MYKQINFSLSLPASLTALLRKKIDFSKSSLFSWISFNPLMRAWFPKLMSLGRAAADSR
ncbi:MAG: hypothetical protein KKC11_05085 [Candidatus Omnitrophica bacterium]|nr:hypothetical protein [Candidatus Omnitrophota bacterium]MBU1809732.1 hypothetical protein [Candidatus Omnitrophota bacterium]